MAMTNRNNTKFDSIIMHTLDELVPQDHLVRKLENALDFRFIYPKRMLIISILKRTTGSMLGLPCRL